MITAFIIIVFWLVIFSVRSAGSVSGTKGDKMANHYGYALFLLIPIYIGFILLDRINPLYSRFFLYICAILSLARIYAHCSAKLGLTKTAYYLGKLSILRFGENPKATDIYCGFKAAMQTKDLGKRRRSLIWLRQRLYGGNSIFSGEMVMYVIIDSLISHPNDRDYLAQKLKLLRDIGTASIPSCVSRLACKLALPPALSRFDWFEINDIATQWNTPAFNPLARYLSEFFGAYIRNSPVYSKFSCWILSLFLLQSREIVRFAHASLQVLKDDYNSTLELAPVEVLMKSQKKVFDEVTREKYLRLLIGNQAKKNWQSRATELGVIQFEEAWKKIESSVRNCEQLMDQENFEVDEQQYQFFEQQQSNLRYIHASIARKLSKDLPGSSFEYFLDWLKVLQVLDSLKSKKHVQQMAFTRIHNEIWNLSADLWNKRKEHCLVHYIATVCSPLALDCGLKDMHKTLSGITLGHFK